MKKELRFSPLTEVEKLYFLKVVVNSQHEKDNRKHELQIAIDRNSEGSWVQKSALSDGQQRLSQSPGETDSGKPSRDLGFTEVSLSSVAILWQVGPCSA